VVVLRPRAALFKALAVLIQRFPRLPYQLVVVAVAHLGLMVVPVVLEVAAGIRQLLAVLEPSGRATTVEEGLTLAT